MKQQGFEVKKEDVARFSPLKHKHINLSFEFISLIFRDFSLSSRAFYLRNGHLTIPCDKKPKNLSETSYENQQNKPETQVINVLGQYSFNLDYMAKKFEGMGPGSKN